MAIAPARPEPVRSRRRDPWRRLSILALVLAAARTEAGASPPAVMGPAVVVAQDARQPSVAVDAKGNVHVALLQGGNVVVATSRDHGAPFSASRVAIDAKGKARGGMQRGPRLGVDGAGRLTVTAPLTYDEAEQKKKYPS